ncbi:calcium-binding protein P-like isoform X2 [Poecilia formosa]|uniref:calcium-binding protein P-like isoform X2 n=1 Tax=Poecilia formosa TaxID=48698 RepID=UPI0007BA8CC2|nr:PREDICTED: calcium-binding protein P-like isoform X2 [Poecilia formosa]
MKLLAFLCMSVLLAHIHLSVAGKIKLFKAFKKTTKTKTNLDAKTKHSILEKAKNPTSNKGSYPKQPEGSYPQYPGSQPQYPARGYPQYPNQHGGYPQYPNQHGGYPQYPNQHGGYPQYPNQHGGYPQYPNQHGGYSNPGSYPGYPARGYPQYPNQHGGSPYHGSYPQYPQYPAGHFPAPGYGGGYGNYPGSYINHNPNNRILSPHYGGSFGFGGYGGGGGSPFSSSVQKMGFAPSDQSKGFGRSAAMAAAGGAMAGMALGYGLGKFPRPNFHFHNPHQEYYYNYYMYKRYGMKSSDRDDYSRDYKFNQTPETFDRFMTSCMKRTDLLPGENQRSQTKPLTTTTTTSTTTSATNTTTTTRSNITAAGNISSISNSTSNPLNKSDVTNVKASQTLQNNEANDDTVSIVEIGYPALITQMKVKRCTELYVVYSEKHLKKNEQSSPHSGIQNLQQGLLFVLMSTTMLMLHN